MLRLLLDENISKKVAVQAKRRCPGIDILSIHDLEKGRYVGADDGEILRVAGAQQMTLVTYDQNTMLTHMAGLVSEGCEHGGIILIDERTIPQRDIGRLVKALCWLWSSECKADWKNRTVYLRPHGAC